ncbi:hypothetical protein MKX01_039835 [Papaver californicum]|nr:hypothetical protein MKX01_039835 [Papaver californicum]
MRAIRLKISREPATREPAILSIQLKRLQRALELDGRLLPRKRIRGGRPVRSTGTSKTLVALNLSSSTAKSDVIKFFEGTGEIVDVRFSYHSCGKFRGVCHVEFATEEAAKKAIKLNGTYLLDRCVELGFSRESIYIRGFDTSSGTDQIRSSLKEHFSSCGEILWMHIPTVDCTGAARGLLSLSFTTRSFPQSSCDEWA